MTECFAGKWDHEADIVVVGFGGAGACAAIEAHDAGSSVVILEKQPENRHYSNTRMSGGGYHSPDAAGDRDALKAYAKAMFSGENLPWKFEGDQAEYSDGLAEIWAEYAPNNCAFMCSLDPDYKPYAGGGAAYPDFPGAKESKYRSFESNYNKEVFTSKKDRSPNTPKEKKVSGEAFHACILNGLKNRDITIHYETGATKLLIDASGTIIGVKAGRSGKDVYYRANKAVILTSGGYEYSKSLRSAFLDGPGVDGWAFYGSSANTGDGIVMALEVGAALSKAGTAAARLIASFPDLLSENGVRIGVGISSAGRGHSVILDNFGNRFCNERDITKNPTRYLSYRYALVFDVNQYLYPRIPAWFVFDESLRTSKSVATSAISDFHGYPWSDDNHEAIERGWILRADTLEKLGNSIKAHPDNHGHMDVGKFRRSIVRFNTFCAKGEDPDFHRDTDTLEPIEKPPFYAIALFPGGPNTNGGLKTNEKRQVIDWNSNVIPRLYAAGEIASVFKFVYQSGGNLGECIVFGRVAGKNAANEKRL